MPESLLSQKVKWNHQHEVQDHLHGQFQFLKRDNLPKYQGDSQNFEQVQMNVMKLNLIFVHGRNVNR